MEGAKKVVIVGGGIIGSSIAYHISLLAKQSNKQYNVTVVERAEIGVGASGKAGGFLASNWCDNSKVGPIARKSFEMHEELSKTFSNSQDYRKVDTVSVGLNPGGSTSKTKSGAIAVDWLDTGYVAGVKSMGTTKTTAQVHPYKLTQAFIKAAQATGLVSVKIATVNGLVFDTSRPEVIKGVTILDSNQNNETIDADVVIITMGPWTGSAKQFFPKDSQAYKHFPNILGQRAHSVVLIPSVSSQEKVFPEISATALFCDLPDDNTPEVYPRCDGTVYICGEGDKVPLPDDPSKISPTNDLCDKLIDFGRSISTALKDAEVKAKQVCYLPVNVDGGGELMGKLRGTENGYVCSGHSCWGILNSPGSGLSMAQLIVNGKSDIDLRPFAP